MNNFCIICKEYLSEIEKSLNMTFHSKCAPRVIEEAWKLLNIEKKNEDR